MAKPNPFAAKPKGGKCPDCGKSPCACGPKDKGNKFPFPPKMAKKKK